MKRITLVAGVVSLSALAGCGGGDINVAPATTVMNSNNTTTTNTGGTNPNASCASYTNSGGQDISGIFDANSGN
ncbi:MAG: hypothetical protein AAGF46_00230, partial [Pseudomonadota bacterium]